MHLDAWNAMEGDLCLANASEEAPDWTEFPSVNREKLVILNLIIITYLSGCMMEFVWRKLFEASGFQVDID